MLFERENNAAACGFLSRLAKKKKYKDELNARLYDRRLLYQGIKSDDPKMRKNAARLMGALQQERDASVLIEALKAETQRYARASMILSIGAVGGDEAISFLEGYEVAPAADETENKHVSEEREALRVALRHVRPVEQHKFAGFKRDIDVELRSPKMLGAQLAAELESASGATERSFRRVTQRSFSMHAASMRCSYRSCGEYAPMRMLLPRTRSIRLSRLYVKPARARSRTGSGWSFAEASQTGKSLFVT